MPLCIFNYGRRSSAMDTSQHTWLREGGAVRHGVVRDNDCEVVALVTALINSGRVRLCGNFAGATLELSPPASSAPAPSPVQEDAPGVLFHSRHRNESCAKASRSLRPGHWEEGMHGQGSHTLVDSHIRAAWQSALAAAKRPSGLLPLLVRQRQELLPRFAAVYQHLREVPRRVQRHLQRHSKDALAGVALVLTLGQGAAWADIINVNGTTCTLINAITTANTGVNTGGCVQTGTVSAADTIVLQPSSVHTLTAVNNSTFGDTGLPVVTSQITIEGQGATIQRDSGAVN